MKLPTSIRVGYRDYAVEPWPVHSAAAAERYGECDRVNGVIRVMDGLAPLFTAEVLLHEVLHAAWDEGSLMDGDGEERVVATTSKVLLQVWRDNPALREFLMLVV